MKFKSAMDDFIYGEPRAIEHPAGDFGDTPVSGDYNRDGRTDIAVWRPSIGDYFIPYSFDGSAREIHWGCARRYSDQRIAAIKVLPNERTRGGNSYYRGQ